MSVYFFVADEVGMVKIGYTYHIWTRLSVAQTNCPVKLRAAAAIDAGPGVERELHSRFAADRVRGDWFRLSPDIRTLIAELGPPPPKVDGRTLRWRKNKAEAGMSLATGAAAVRAAAIPA